MFVLEEACARSLGGSGPHLICSCCRRERGIPLTRWYIHCEKKGECFVDTYHVVEELQHRTKDRYRLRPYVYEYLTRCISYQEQVSILSVWCLGPTVSQRIARGELVSLPSERRVFADIGALHQLLASAGFVVNHFLFLTGGAFPRARIRESDEIMYEHLIRSIVASMGLDVIVERRLAARPDESSAAALEGSRTAAAVLNEAERYRKYAERQYGWRIPEREARSDAFETFCSAIAEARALVTEFGDFLFVPADGVDRYRFHDSGIEHFTDRIVPCIELYPWRPQ